MQVQSLGWEDPLEEGMTTHSSSLAWRIPWTEEPGGLQSMGVTKSQTQLERLSTHRLSSLFCSMNLLHASCSLPLCQLTPYLWAGVVKCFLHVCVHVRTHTHSHTLTQEAFDFLTQKACTVTDHSGCVQLHILKDRKVAVPLSQMLTQHSAAL